MKVDLAGQTALLTGATRGIGWQLAQDMARVGCRVLLSGTNLSGANEAAKALEGQGHKGFGVDFVSEESTRTFLTAVAREQRIDILVNNAGINRINPVDKLEDRDWHAMQLVNLEAPMRITRAVSTLMKTAGYGRIVNIASIFGVVSKENRALYSMTKFGLRGLTLAAAHDLAPFGVLVNSVSPGFVRTQLTDSILSSADQAALATQVPLGRFASPEEISRVILFLVSPLNTYLTGQNIIVDGGFVAG